MFEQSVLHVPLIVTYTTAGRPLVHTDISKGLPEDGVSFHCIELSHSSVLNGGALLKLKTKPPCRKCKVHQLYTECQSMENSGKTKISEP